MVLDWAFKAEKWGWSFNKLKLSLQMAHVVAKRPSCPQHELSKYTCRGCHPHSHPEANFILNMGNLTRLELIGNLKELPAVLKLAGYNYDPAKTLGNIAQEGNEIKKHFSKKLDLLSNQTLQALCKYLAFDYYLLPIKLWTTGNVHEYSAAFGHIVHTNGSTNMLL